MIRFGAIVSVVAVALGLLVVGAVAGDLTLVYASIGLAALALLMLIAGVVIWRDELFGARATSEAKATQVEPEFVTTSARGGTAAAGARPRSIGRATVRSAGGPAPADRPAGYAATAGQPAHRPGGEDNGAAVSGRGAASASHRPGGHPVHAGDTRAGPALVPAAGREQRDRDQRDHDRRDRDQREREQRERDQPGSTRPLPSQPAAVRPYAASAGATVPSGAERTRGPERTGASDRAAASERASARESARESRPPGGAEPGRRQAAGGAPEPSGSGRSDRGPFAPASPFFTPASKSPAAEPSHAKPASPATSGDVKSATPASTSSASPTSSAASPVGATASLASLSQATATPAAAPSARKRTSADSTHYAARDGAAASARAASARSDGMVSVVPGIARYHMPDCILIRFLSDDDLEIVTLQAAEEMGCAPCRACRPEHSVASA